MKISAFDLDYTLFSVNSSYRFGLYLIKKGHLSLGAFPFLMKLKILFALGNITISDLHALAFNTLFKGQREDQVIWWAQEFIEANFSAFLRPSIYTKFLEAQKLGHVTALLSSSPSFLVQPIAHKLNFTHFEATRYVVDKDLRFCDISHLVLGETKVEYIAELKEKYEIEENGITAYSDSHHDLPFLLAADNPIAVAPDRTLRKHCLSNTWPIIEK